MCVVLQNLIGFDELDILKILPVDLQDLQKKDEKLICFVVFLQVHDGYTDVLSPEPTFNNICTCFLSSQAIWMFLVLRASGVRGYCVQLLTMFGL